MSIPPCVFNVYKPAGISSYDVIRHFKRNIQLGRKYKVGHFGTLDPFAEGVLLIAFSRASRLNDYVHNELTKTYIAEGVLGIETPTGDMTSDISNEDKTEFFSTELPRFTIPFIEKTLKNKFEGEYLQAPHRYSAAKFEGKKLYEWAREGIEVKKEKKKRYIHKIEVLEYSHPRLRIRYEVSSGTYIRTLFSDCANYLGTLGCLEKLYREKVGDISMENSLKEKDWPVINEEWNWEEKSICLKNLLPLGEVSLGCKDSQNIKNGLSVLPLKSSENKSELCWVFDESSKLLSLGKWVDGGKVHPVINF